MKHQPNFENLRRTLLREGPPSPVPFFEIGAEPGVMGAVLGEGRCSNQEHFGAN